MRNSTTIEADQKPFKDRINWIELLSTIVLSISAIANAWCGFQAAKWGGEQRVLFTKAGVSRMESVRTFLDGGQKLFYDSIFFNEWLKAVNQEDERLENFYFNRLGDLQPSVEAWIETRPLENPASPSSPFKMEEYKNDAYEEAEQQMTQAGEFFEKGLQAGQMSDKYIQNGVILASVLFFAGIATQFKHRKIQIFLIALGTVWLVIGLYSIITFQII